MPFCITSVRFSRSVVPLMPPPARPPLQVVHAFNSVSRAMPSCHLVLAGVRIIKNRPVLRRSKKGERSRSPLSSLAPAHFSLTSPFESSTADKGRVNTACLRAPASPSGSCACRHESVGPCVLGQKKVSASDHPSPILLTLHLTHLPLCASQP